MDLEPPRANLNQLQTLDKQHLVYVEDDVMGVVHTLKRIDRNLHMRFDPQQEVFVLYWEGLNPQGHVVEQLVGAYRELDHRIVKLIERIDAEGRGHQDLNRELQRLEDERDREMEYRRQQSTGDLAEKLAHAIRSDLGKPKGIAVP